MEKIRVSAKTLDEAIIKASIELSTTSDCIKYDTVAEGSRGLFGIGAKPWIIEAYKEENDEFSYEAIKASIKKDIKDEELKQQKLLNKKSEKKPKPVKIKKNDEIKSEKKDNKKVIDKEEELHFSKKTQVSNSKKPENKAKRKADRKLEKKSDKKIDKKIKAVSSEMAKKAEENATSFIDSVMKGMDIDDVKINTAFNPSENELSIDLEGKCMGVVIGKRGQTLDSLQYLTSLVVNRDNEDSYIRIKLDTENYRKKRENTLRRLAKNIANKVKKTKKKVSLEPMNPYERRIIHSTLQHDRFVATKSEGHEPFRHVIIYCRNKKQS